jgi:hypothetical protein
MRKAHLILLSAAAFLLFAGLLTWQMLGHRRHKVEVCMEFAGRTACRVASAPTREEAVRAATGGACSLIASGVTDTQICGRSNPVSVRQLD